MPDNERKALTDRLTRQADVRDISSTLRETAIDFQVTQIYLTDPYGTIVGDSLFETAVNNLGATAALASTSPRPSKTAAPRSSWSAASPKCRASIFPPVWATQKKPSGLVIVKPRIASPSTSDGRRQPPTVCHRRARRGLDEQPKPRRSAAHRNPGHAQRERGHFLSLYQKVPALLDWEFDSVHVRGKNITTVRKGGHRYLVLSTPWPTAICKSGTSFHGRRIGVIAAWSAGMALVLLMGYAFLAFRDQRAQRIQTLTQGQRDLQDMAQALPLTVFRYHQPAQGPGISPSLAAAWKNAWASPLTSSHKTPPAPGAWRNCPPCARPPRAWSFGAAPQPPRLAELPQPGHAPPRRQPHLQRLLGRHHRTQTSRCPLASRVRARPFCFLFFDSDLAVTRCNPAALAMFGAQSEQDLIGLRPNLPPAMAPHGSR